MVLAKVAARFEEIIALVMLRSPYLLIAAFSLTSTLFAASAEVERGRYLVEEVGKCQMCHTPKLESGEYDKTKWLKGATLDIQPIGTIKGWHKTAPDLTSTGRLFERWKAEGIQKFMQTGLNPRGGGADAPMPTYKLNEADAKAIVEYLKTLQ